MKLIFASNNIHKIEELKTFVGNQFEIISLKDANINHDIPEPFATLEENAAIKSRTIFEMTGMNCFSEDTGLEIESLNGEPGVKSARYAGKDRSFKNNIAKVLNKLAHHENRKARFRAVISLIIDGMETQFEGICNGTIICEEKGNAGFGYDPVFVPDGAHKTFAEMTLTEKNKYNHRTKAAAKLLAFLKLQKTKSLI
ncbi:MAG TPA: RdgB/HAM1 family non-canonical purine NTP pyrophosphatase [Chitinophagaceae bacterium]|nr:RdgB/HAM1 family non-canonical purine NTP pyrophosphatase [Chitinophagaceae bacterium]